MLGYQYQLTNAFKTAQLRSSTKAKIQKDRNKRKVMLRTYHLWKMFGAQNVSNFGIFAYV